MANQTSAVARSMADQRRQPGDDKEKIQKVGYVYSATISAVASGTNGAIGQINIQADSAFLVQYLVGFAHTAAFALVADPFATVQITDTGSGSNLFNEPQYFRNIFGTASLPLILATPRLLLPNSQLQFTLNNLNSAANMTYQMSFHGRKLYKVGNRWEVRG